MEVKKGYKQTDIGILPNDWTLEFIKDVAHIKTGKKNTQDKVDDGDYPFFVRSQVVERINSWSFDGEAVLTAGDGVGTGKVFHYINGKCDIHQRVYKISDFVEALDGYYFYLYFSQNFFNRIMQMTAKSSVDSVRMEMIADMQIPVPINKDEQKEIARAVKDISTLIGRTKDLLEKKQKIKQGAMQELLTGKKRLPEFAKKWDGKYKKTDMGMIPSDWTPNVIGDVLKIMHGKGQKDVLDANGKYPILATGGIIGYANQFLYDKESVLIGRKGTIDRPFYMDTPFWTVDTLFYSVIFPNHSARFLYYKFLMIDWYLYNEASGVPSLNAKTIEQIPIGIPSHNEQKEIVSVLLEMDNEIAYLETKLEKYRQLKQGMMQNLLTGKIRLV